MLRHVLFDLNLFPTEAERANSQKRVLVLLEALTLINEFYLAEHPETPLMYKAGIKYKMPAQFEKETSPEVDSVSAYLQQMSAPTTVRSAFRTISNQIGGGETFRDIPRIIENGGGDCDNVACWRAAELRYRLGVPVKPYITWRSRPDGGVTYHVINLWPDGSSEDPSLLLGMGGPERDADRREEERKLGERAGEMLSTLTGGAREVVVGDEVRRRLGMSNLRSMFLAQHQNGGL